MTPECGKPRKEQSKYEVRRPMSADGLTHWAKRQESPFVLEESLYHQVTVENSGLYCASPETPCIFTGSSTASMNTSSGRSHSQRMLCLLAEVTPNRG